jgi:hypothetical protein
MVPDRWWPTASVKTYRVMTDLVIWFGLWDDVIERLADDAAESLRVSTKDFIRRGLGLAEDDDEVSGTTNPLIRSFQPIAAEARAFYNKGKNTTVCYVHVHALKNKKRWGEA